MSNEQCKHGGCRVCPVCVTHFRHHAKRAAFEEVQAILVQPESWEERARRALALVTEYITRPEARVEIQSHARTLKT
jgi:hypothetical protein